MPAAVKTRRRPTTGAGRDLAPDGLPWPELPLSYHARIVRRAVIGYFDRNMTAAGEALGVTRNGVRHWITGRRAVTDEHVEQLAEVIGTTADALRDDDPESIRFGGVRCGPDDPRYEALRQVLSAMLPVPDEDDSPLAPTCTSLPPDSH